MWGSLLHPSYPCNCFKPNLIWDNQQKDDPGMSLQVSTPLYRCPCAAFLQGYTQCFFSSNTYKKSWPLLYIKTSFYIEPSVDTSVCYWADRTTQARFYEDELVVCLWTFANAVLVSVCIISRGTTDQANYFSSALVLEAALWYFRPTCLLLSDHNAATRCIIYLCHHAHTPAVEWLNAPLGSLFVTTGLLRTCGDISRHICFEVLYLWLLQACNKPIQSFHSGPIK